MYSRSYRFAPSTSRAEDFQLAVVIGFLLAVFAGLGFGFYWLMQPTVVVNYGSAYHPPPGAVVHYANTPWVPPAPSEATVPIAEPESVAPASVVAEQPKKETKKQQVVRVAPRRPRPAREQPDPFRGGFASSPSYGWGGYASSRSYGSRPWF